MSQVADKFGGRTIHFQIFCRNVYLNEECRLLGCDAVWLL
jgi:hypothetical protein